MKPLLIILQSLDRKDRANLIDDAFNLAGAQRIDYGLALSMTSYLKKEKEFLPWATASNALKEVTQFLSSSSYYPNMKVNPTFYKKRLSTLDL